MTEQRIPAFGDAGLSDFAPKAKPALRNDKEQLEKVAEESGFVSRQAPKPPSPKRMGPRNPHTTGRNVQLNIKARGVAIERLHKLADGERLPLGEMLEKLMDAFDAQKGQTSTNRRN